MFKKRIKKFLTEEEDWLMLTKLVDNDILMVKRPDKERKKMVVI